MTRLERGGSELSECQIRFSVSFAIFSQINIKVGQFQKILMLSRTKFGPFLISPVLVQYLETIFGKSNKIFRNKK